MRKEDIEKVLDIVSPYVTKITNIQYSEEFPLLGDEYVDECTVKRILKNYIQLALIWDKKHEKDTSI